MAEDAWIMKGMAWNDPYRIRSWQELVNWVNEVGFLPLFANNVSGFSAEEHVAADFWWTGDPEQDPWIWREIIAGSRRAAYGKFFGGKAGFISIEWLPRFVNCRREGYDFDARWEDGLAGLREKKIMDLLTGTNEEGDILWKNDEFLSTDIKKMAGFGKGKEKNFPGIVTSLQMQTYLVITGFHRRKNKKGVEYGMPVSVLQPPEAVWGYETVTRAYNESPAVSWERIFTQVKTHFPDGKEKEIIALIGKKPSS